MVSNVLVFPSATYPAIQIIDCLKNSPLFHVIAGASYPNHAEFVCEDTKNDIPYINDKGFIKYLIDLITELKIDYIIPTDETAALFLKENETIIPAVIVCSPYETARLCRYKSLTYKRIAGEKYTPRVYNLLNKEEIDDYPVFIKPDSSQGSKGAMIINNNKELSEIKSLDKYVICEYLPGEEYTVDCFTNKNRTLVFCNPRIRTRLMNGITARGNSVPITPEFSEIIESLNSKIEFRGYWYVQLKRDKNGHLKLLEICTRFAGSFAISKGKGVNLPLLALLDFAGLKADVVQNDYIVECDKTYIDRYRLKIEYNHIYIDYDDTITTKDGTAVNPYVMAYLYECKYKRIKISLITRHSDTFNELLKDSFKKLSISRELFDEVLEIGWNTKKKEVMTDINDAIFIDNSFDERKDIYETFNIPVFDVTNIDCLFDWRF